MVKKIISALIVLLLAVHPVITIPDTFPEFEIAEEDYELKESVDKFKEDLDWYYNARSTAETFLGQRGDCYLIVRKFVFAFYGKTTKHYKYVKVAYEDALPGDIVFYKNNGLGREHWAIYLGDDEALHGNFNGTTIFYSIYMNKTSKPTFFRLVERD